MDAAKDARVVIMNPPFTNRVKMGEKFPKETQNRLRSRADAMENILVSTDEDMDGFMDKNSIAPLFVALADHSLNPNPPKSRGISAGAWVKDAARWRCGYDADAGAF